MAQAQDWYTIGDVEFFLQKHFKFIYERLSQFTVEEIMSAEMHYPSRISQ